MKNYFPQPHFEINDMFSKYYYFCTHFFFLNQFKDKRVLSLFSITFAYYSKLGHFEFNLKKFEKNRFWSQGLLLYIGLTVFIFDKVRKKLSYIGRIAIFLFFNFSSQIRKMSELTLICPDNEAPNKNTQMTHYSEEFLTTRPLSM